MVGSEIHLAQRWSRLRCEMPQVVFYDKNLHGHERLLRRALRDVGVPVLEFNDLSGEAAVGWLNAALHLSQEFLIPIMVFGKPPASYGCIDLPKGECIDDPGWLSARQSALITAIEDSDLHQEWRRCHEKTGWVCIGWRDPAQFSAGNVLLLAWTSPLPLMRIRNFSARCPIHLKIEGPDADTLANDVASQGISVSHWQIAVK